MALKTRKLTKLEAVNILLRNSREHVVSSLETDKTNESLLAEQVLDNWDLNLQAIGLFNNTFERDLEPATVVSTGIKVGDVVLPPNTLEVEAWGQHINRLFDAREDKGNLKLFNLETTEETFDFSDFACVTVKMVLMLDYDDLSAKQQNSIAYQAAVEYQMNVVGSDSVDRMLRGFAARFRAEARAENMRKKKANLFTTSRSNLGRAGARSVVRNYFPAGDGSQKTRRLS